MNAPVDVLGVLDGEIAGHESEVTFCRTEGNFHTAREIEMYQLAPLREARAAVAELVAATRLAVTLDRITHGLREAIARVQGGAA